MNTLRALVIVAVGLLLSTRPLQAQDRARYRDFRLGSSLSSVLAEAHVAASEARTIHQRPAVMRELEWRPSSFVSGSTALQHDPVRQIIFSFFDDQLSRMVVDYDHERTAGMTGSDLVDAISSTYGPPVKAPLKKVPTGRSQIDDESGAAVARWGDADYSVVLYQAADFYLSPTASRFRIIVTSPRLEALARTADAEAIRLDEREAPLREIARQKKDMEDTREAQEKARVENKAAFRP